MVSTNVTQLHHSNLRSLGVKTNHRKVLIICVKVTYYGCVMNLCIKLESSLCPILTLVFCFVLYHFRCRKTFVSTKIFYFWEQKGKKIRGYVTTRGDNNGLERSDWLSHPSICVFSQLASWGFYGWFMNSYSCQYTPKHSCRPVLIFRILGKTNYCHLIKRMLFIGISVSTL